MLDGWNLGFWRSQKQHAPSTYFKGWGRVRFEILNYSAVPLSWLMLFGVHRNGSCYKGIVS